MIMGLDDLEMGSFEDTRLTIGSISTPSAPFDFETIVTLNILDSKANFACEFLKIQLTLNLKAWVFHCKFIFPLHFFTINDGKN
jgi:hypothetical protein